MVVILCAKKDGAQSFTSWLCFSFRFLGGEENKAFFVRKGNELMRKSLDLRSLRLNQKRFLN